VDVSYVLFCEFSYMLQKPQGNHNGIKSVIYQVLRLIYVMYFCTISSLFFYNITTVQPGSIVFWVLSLMVRKTLKFKVCHQRDLL